MPSPATIKAEIAIKEGPKDALKELTIPVDSYIPFSVTVPSKPEEGEISTYVLDGGKPENLQFLLLHIPSGQYVSELNPMGSPALEISFSDDERKVDDLENAIGLDGPMLLVGPALSMLSNYKRLTQLNVRNNTNMNVEIKILIGKTQKARGKREPEMVMAKAGKRS